MTNGTFPARSLDDLVACVASPVVRGDAHVGVTDVACRSDDVTAGSMFFCVPGLVFDGHDFAPDAVARGASVLVVERWLADAGVTQVRVGSVRESMGPLAAEFFDRPSERMRAIGVTGTNGKTTVTYLLESIFRESGLVPGIVGTTGAHVDGERVPFPRTTPEAPDLQRLLARMVDAGVAAVAMEVSSHGLAQHRVDGSRFDCAVFTNLSLEHLDYHGTMEEYFSAKRRLFTPAFTGAAAINVDDAHGRRLAAAAEQPAVTFGIQPGARVRAEDVEADAGGIAFRVGDLRVRSRLRGAFNVSNCLAALAAARAVGIGDDAIARGIAGVRRVPGRVESIDEGQGFLVLVDYAHTPDGVENVLRAARPLASGRVIVVLGCGGDRDLAKRPLMGRAATSLADLTVITSDNPRSEDPLGIIAEIEPGAREGGGTYVVEADRRAAIRLAVREAGEGDVVVIAGKGHETGQEFAGRTIPFDDRVVASEELGSLRGGA